MAAWGIEYASWGIYKSIVSAKGYRQSFSRSALEFSSRSLGKQAFAFESILEDAIAFRDVGLETHPDERLRRAMQGRSAKTLQLNVPLNDERDWRKLCYAAGQRPYSNYGGHLLRDKIVRVMGNRLLIDEIRFRYKTEIEQQKVVKPIIFIGLPRCNAHMGVHCANRTGLTLGIRDRDTMFPGIVNEAQREELARKVLRGRDRIEPFLATIRQHDADQVDDDLSLQLLTPSAVAWGLWHGLDDYCYECIQEDQQPVYDRVRDVLQVFQWYRKENNFSDCVTREVTSIDNPLNLVQDGTKDQISKFPPWAIQCPLGLLTVDKLHAAFPDCRLVWCHRALAYCIPSFCSALAFQHSYYTGRRATDSKLASIGEQVLGMFGSGSENAIKYLAGFPKERMVHWSNREIQRHCTRLLTKTMNTFEFGIDYYRRLQTVNGFTEYSTRFRPKHDSDLGHFALNEGVLNQAFEAYILQFEEYAFEKKFGMSIQNYKSLSGTLQESKASIDPNFGDRQTSLNHMPSPGHFLQERSK